MRGLAGIILATFVATSATAEDRLLDQALEFTGQVFHLDRQVPGLVIAGIRNGETVVHGFGEVRKGTGRTPNGDTKVQVGSLTKTFTGLILADVVAEGTVALTDQVEPHVDLVDEMPHRDGKAIRFVDLATHASGLPRELELVPGVDKYSDDTFVVNLEGDPLLFAPGTGLFYSNLGFDVLAMALAGATDTLFDEMVEERILGPLRLADTSYARSTDDNRMTGYDWNGHEMDPGPSIANRHGASGLTTTANDMLRYLAWNLDQFGETGAEMRHLAHAAHVVRDGLTPVYGLDESGRMDAMGLGWVIMMPEGDRPLIIQKAGGTNGIFSYIAFAPTRGVGVFIAINQFDFSAGMDMAGVVNELITSLAPR